MCMQPPIRTLPRARYAMLLSLNYVCWETRAPLSSLLILLSPHLGISPSSPSTSTPPPPLSSRIKLRRCVECIATDVGFFRIYHAILNGNSHDHSDAGLFSHLCYSWWLWWEWHFLKLVSSFLIFVVFFLFFLFLWSVVLDKALLIVIKSIVTRTYLNDEFRIDQQVYCTNFGTSDFPLTGSLISTTTEIKRKDKDRNFIS